jgi:hypothetical protein
MELSNEDKQKFNDDNFATTQPVNRYWLPKIEAQPGSAEKLKAILDKIE